MDKYLTSFLENPSLLVEKFNEGWSYPIRSLPINKKLQYRLLPTTFQNPDFLCVEIQDEISVSARERVETECARYQRYISETKGCFPLRMDVMVPMLPVVVRVDGRKMMRAEVMEIKWSKGEVCVCLVDSGDLKWVSGSNVFPPSLTLLRFPQLAMISRLSQVVPYKKAAKWPPIDYSPYLCGKKSSSLRVCNVVQGILEVYLECDNVDVGFDLVINKAKADFFPLKHLEKDETCIGAYPLNDFSDWIGQKIEVFGTKFAECNNVVTVHLQLDTVLANDIWNKIDALPEKLPPSSRKEVGDPVLVNHESVRYRATILKKTKSSFVVQLVDFGDFIRIDEKDMFQIPDELIKFPEAATPCAIAELMDHVPTEEMKNKIKKMIPEQNLYCVIGDSEFIDHTVGQGAKEKCIVSISQPLGENGAEIPFWKTLGLSPVPYVHTFKHDHELLPQELAPKLLVGVSDYFPGTYRGVLACVQSEISVFLHLENDRIKADKLTDEMSEFYKNWLSCPPIDPEEVKDEAYFAAQRNNEDGCWYRAKIVDCLSPGTCKVLYLDYGTIDVITIDKMKPLAKYFGMEKSLALEVALPINLIMYGAKKSESDPESIIDFITGFCGDAELSVLLQRTDACTYAWIHRYETSLAHAMRDAGIAKLKFENTNFILEN